MVNCTLCGGIDLMLIDVSEDTCYYHHCQTCNLIFMDPRFHLSKEMEQSRYLFHDNGLENSGYVDFLNRAIQPCLPLLNHNMIGLDYGCGPVPTLSKLLAIQGIVCYDYDPLFDFSHPHTSYDFIFATECVEHFYSPQKEFLSITNLLKQGGYLTIMTDQWESIDKFKNWYYRRDQTHVAFFHKTTFFYLCEQYGYVAEYSDGNRVVILRKK